SVSSLIIKTAVWSWFVRNLKVNGSINRRLRKLKHRNKKIKSLPKSFKVHRREIKPSRKQNNGKSLQKLLRNQALETLYDGVSSTERELRAKLNRRFK
ncbi:hypothetical protein L9F63_025556, partial [Diploptera punctata]